MTEWLKNQKALATPANADLPYSDPVTAAPAAAGAFHAHLDVCEQCRNHPFALCSVGAQLLVATTAAVRPPIAEER